MPTSKPRRPAAYPGWPGLLTIAQLAAYTNTPTRAVRKACGLAPVFVTTTPLWSRADVDAWIASLARAPQPQSPRVERSLEKVRARTAMSTRLQKTRKSI